MNKKSITILCLILLPLFSAPIISDNAGAVSSIESIASEIDTVQEGEELTNVLGNMFSMFRTFGGSGEMFADVLELLFTNFENMSNTESDVRGMYVLNASLESEEAAQTEQLFNDDKYVYYPWSEYSLENATDPVDQDEQPYFVLERNGSITYTVDSGASITFIIWDDDSSFIDALDKVINSAKTFVRISNEVESGATTDEQAQSEALATLVEAVTYFLIHINDIITGDEVIIVNLIGYTNYHLDFSGAVMGEWYATENGVATENSSRTLENVYPDWKTDFNVIADLYNDEHMQYILGEEWDMNETTKDFTAFSFDLIELWLKEFQVSIDTEAIIATITGDAGEDYFDGKTATDIFQELKLEFYVFTHHFQNYYLFDDEKFADPMYNATDQAKAGNGVPDVTWETVGEFEGVPVERISDTEIDYYLLFQGASVWSFVEPIYNTDAGEMSWGIHVDNLEFRVMPLGMEDDQVNLTVAPIETLDYLELGFTFKPTRRDNVDTGGYDYINAKGETTMGSAKVKLVQEFGMWDRDTDDKPFTPALKDKDYQLSTVFLSTIFHFKLWIENRQITEGAEEPSQALLGENNYNRSTAKVKVGNVENDLPLAEIDIAGPNYTMTTAEGVSSEHLAKTNVIPALYAEWEGENSETYTQEDNSTAVINSTVNFDYSMLLYAVSYDVFDSSGNQIVHDPTFSIFIVSENPGIWAVILVVGSVTLVGVAAVMITKRKQA
ncbi:MAG: hypothetical protein ACTSYI_15660 [Promethearchaeota archaeon]